MSCKYRPEVTMTVGINPFVRRQTKNSRFSHYEGDLLDVAVMVCANWSERKRGYRDGVVLVPVPPEGFFSSIVTLKEGDVLVGDFSARQKGEEPRRHVGVVGGQKLPAKRVEIVLYSRETLAEGDEERTNNDWDIISINASPTDDEVPIPPMTLLANHFQLSGGTATHMTDSELVAALRESVLFWKDKALVADAGTVKQVYPTLTQVMGQALNDLFKGLSS